MAGKKGIAKTDRREKPKTGKIKSKPTAKTKLERIPGGASGLDLIPLFNRNNPKTKIVVLTIMQGEPYRAALQMGADVFVHKTNMTQTLVPAITDLMKPASAVPPANTSSNNPANSSTRRWWLNSCACWMK